MKAVVLLPMASMNGLISFAPKAQFRPILRKERRKGLTGKPFVSHHWFVLHLEEQLFGLMYSNSPERISMRYAHYKGFSGLTRQSPSTAVHNGP